MAHDGFPQRVVYQDFLVLHVHQLADAAVQSARGAGLADLALTRDPKHGDAPAAPDAQARPRPGRLGIGQSLKSKLLGGEGQRTRV